MPVVPHVSFYISPLPTGAKPPRKGTVGQWGVKRKKAERCRLQGRVVMPRSTAMGQGNAALQWGGRPRCDGAYQNGASHDTTQQQSRRRTMAHGDLNAIRECCRRKEGQVLEWYYACATKGRSREQRH